jgi:hypothetical protein
MKDAWIYVLDVVVFVAVADLKADYGQNRARSSPFFAANSIYDK